MERDNNKFMSIWYLSWLLTLTLFWRWWELAIRLIYNIISSSRYFGIIAVIWNIHICGLFGAGCDQTWRVKPGLCQLLSWQIHSKWLLRKIDHENFSSFQRRCILHWYQYSTKSPWVRYLILLYTELIMLTIIYCIP